MIGLETTIPLYISLFLQVIVLPSQLINVVVRRGDQTRIRFLLLTGLFLSFNLFSILLVHFSGDPFSLSNLSLRLMGLIVLVFTYHYLGKETQAFNSSAWATKLFIVLSCAGLFEELLYGHWASIFSRILFVGIALFFSVTLMKNASKGRNGTSPIYYGALLATTMSCLIPIISVLIESNTLELICFNLIYFNIGITYFIQHVKQLKLESTIVKVNSLLYSSTLVERNELSALKPDKVVLTKRETEVLNLLLQNLDHQQIADALNMNYDNARKHASNIYSKFGVSSNAELLVAFSRSQKKN